MSKLWEELSPKEKADFAEKVKQQHPQGWQELFNLAIESGIDAVPDTFPTVYELEHWTVSDMVSEQATITITRAPRGTARRVVPISQIQIPDLWHLAAYLKEKDLPQQSEAVLECWHLCHDLLENLRDPSLIGSIETWRAQLRDKIEQG